MKCLAENCERIAVCRGLCWKHYCAAQRKVGGDQQEWDKLVSAGLALPRAKGGVKSDGFANRCERAIKDLPGQTLIPEIAADQKGSQ